MFVDAKKRISQRSLFYTTRENISGNQDYDLLGSGVM
jgi:hypothetical protein